MILIVILVFINNLSAGPSGWEKNEIIIAKDGYQPSVAFYRDNIFITYIRSDSDRQHVYFKGSTNEGKTWLKEIPVASGDHSCSTPKIIFLDRRIYIFWVDFKDGNNEIYYTYSEDPLGKSFKPPIRITSNSSDSIQPTLVSSPGKIVLIWSDDMKKDYELFSMMYDTVKNSWSEYIQITSYSGGSFYPDALMMLDEIHLVWQQKEGDKWKIMYNKSEDGIAWIKPVNVSSGLSSGLEPKISLSPGGLKVVFQGQQDHEYEIYVNSYEYFSERWLIPMKITRNVNIEYSPTLISSMDGIFAFWYDYSEGNNEIIYTISDDEGLIWNDRVNLTETKGDSHNYDIIYNSFNNNIYIVWEEENKGQIAFKKKDIFCPIPTIVATSHQSNTWSFEKNAVFKWKVDEDSSGIQDFAYMINDDPTYMPDLFLAEYPIDEAKFYNLKDGIWYFHLRARDTIGNMSKVLHYPLKINSKLYLEKVIYYVVKYGDTLWEISEKHYKDPKLYPIIASYNQINNPKMIYPHQIIKIPPRKPVIK